MCVGSLWAGGTNANELYGSLVGIMGSSMDTIWGGCGSTFGGVWRLVEKSPAQSSSDNSDSRVSPPSPAGRGSDTAWSRGPWITPRGRFGSGWDRSASDRRRLRDMDGTREAGRSVVSTTLGWGRWRVGVGEDGRGVGS